MHVAWYIRFGLLLCLVALALFALMSPQLTPSPAPAAAVPTVLVSPTSTPPPPTVRPTQTPQPITSIIVRQTAVPQPTATPFPDAQPTVSIVDYSFMPGVIRVKAGDTILWRNDGTDQHDVTGSDWHSGLLDPTYSYDLTFGIPGTYAYRCSIHLDMTGTVIVS
ncbi:MAG: cupredoxin domain-containing protein [Chloroflexi bacterium]|nr:cupredoxin domain-containing protein [Chloroflexota bacterium]